MSNISLQTSEILQKNASAANLLIKELEVELTKLNKEYSQLLIRQLKDENGRLLTAINSAKQRLSQLEGNKSPVLNLNLCSKIENSPAPSSNENQSIQATKIEPSKTDAKETKPKKEKKPKEPKETANTELPIDIGRLDLRIGKVEHVERHPDADSLYVLKINCGEKQPRTVCSGLVKHVPIEELRDRSVLLLCNLKPVKMRGITSEAMVMCASSEQGVEVLIPPDGAQPGDLVTCQGYKRQPDAVMNPKKKIFETVAPDLHTNDELKACYKSKPLEVEGKGYFVAKSLKNVPVK